MRRLGLAVALTLVVAVGAAALDIPLTYVKYSDGGRRTFQPMGRAMIQCQAGAPQGEYKLPKLLSKRTVHGTYELAGQQLMMVLDQQKADSPFFNRIYFDANGNKDLTDDPVIDGMVNAHGGNFFYSQFDPCDVTLKVGEGSFPFSFIPAAHLSVPDGKIDSMSGDSLARHMTVYITTNCMYSGALDLDGQHFEVMLGDGDANGLFDDFAKFPSASPGQPNMYRLPTGDQLFLSATKRVDYYDFLPLGQYLSVGGRLFGVKVDLAGGKMVFSDPDCPLVSAKLSMETEHLILCSPTADTCVMLHRPGTQATVPAGSYIPVKYKALRNDEQGDLWGLVAFGTGKSPASDLSATGATVAFGAPFTPSVDIDERHIARLKSGRMNDLPMELNIAGQAHERVVDISHLQGNRTKVPMSGRRPKEARYKIVKTDGEVVAQGTFEYG